MIVAALLSWYEEDPDWLRDMVANLPAAGVSHLVAVDGAYDRFPGGRNQSDDKQHRALIRECKRQNIALTVYVPPTVWATEMDKRTHLFRLGETVTSPDDWFLVMDGDELIETVPDDFHTRLETTVHDSAKVTFYEPHPHKKGRRFSIPILYRAQRGITVEGNHYTYKAPDGRDLWGQGRYAPAEDLTDVVVLHRTHLRAKDRKQASLAYYKQRDKDLVEIGMCERCGAQGTSEIPYDWAPLKEPPEGHDPNMGFLSAVWVAVCDQCKPILTHENIRTFEAHGLDPKQVQMTYDIVNT